MADKLTIKVFLYIQLIELIPSAKQTRDLIAETASVSTQSYPAIKAFSGSHRLKGDRLPGGPSLGWWRLCWPFSIFFSLRFAWVSVSFASRRQCKASLICIAFNWDTCVMLFEGVFRWTFNAVLFKLTLSFRFFWYPSNFQWVVLGIYYLIMENSIS